jgi:hypothetical protein
MPSLQSYVLVEQEVPAVISHSRMEPGFVREVYTGLECVIPLPELDIELPLADVYDEVEFIHEAE